LRLRARPLRHRQGPKSPYRPPPARGFVLRRLSDAKRRPKLITGADCPVWSRRCGKADAECGSTSRHCSPFRSAHSGQQNHTSDEISVTPPEMRMLAPGCWASSARKRDDTPPSLPCTISIQPPCGQRLAEVAQEAAATVAAAPAAILATPPHPQTGFC